MVYTTSSLFLKSLSLAGITHAFVNWGSDHPAMLEELQRQRFEGEHQGATSPRVITCPNEMVALSAAQGYAQVTGRPAAVIIHVDVGTQALAGAIHNVDRGRVPVLIYAGASPFTSRNEMKGSRNEWIMWLQDIPDQTAIVRQYMRYTAQINSGRNVVQIVKRALQIATSEPKGPVYLWARREVMEEELPFALYNSLSMKPHISVSPAALSPVDTMAISTALLTALHPLIITSHIGRNQDAVSSVLTLSTLLAVPVFCVCPSTVNIPFSHPFLFGITYLSPGPTTDSFEEHLQIADTVLVLDSDIPWIPSKCGPSEDGSRVFIIDSGDPLKTNVAMGTWDAALHRGVELICCADTETAVGQLVDVTKEHIRGSTTKLETVILEIRDRIKQRAQRIKQVHDKWIARLDGDEFIPDVAKEGSSNLITVPHIMRALREVAAPISSKSLIINEAISNYGVVWEHARAEFPGSLLTSGGSSLGYALGACVGAVLGSSSSSGTGSDTMDYDLVTAVVGDGTFMFGVPSSAFWIARRYNTPFLTIVLNNGGWKSPKLSMLAVHPQGHGSKARSGEQLSVGFSFESRARISAAQSDRISPSYSQIAVAATDGWAWGRSVSLSSDNATESLDLVWKTLKGVLAEAVRIVIEEKRCAVVDCLLEAL
ncbi:thiamine pyrophosphate enzyme, N-terminal TPP binding domain-containing protein [Lentinula lateritia]|uniref:Thiamine pyrophosphate enzyme, N-terminal TPP binding domain-containing protein n=1 Tax=Lentinula aff. lateritia TaxID=2804960 RepID=A0ACC1TKF2_9AGAR|nr:thiamine pyrophosphate enzyme, N-terminal TPP binding domain-containing protein [Lentinula aff. lateritia]KAJ3849123.1 thiamine pyrophosphate enzyme, N-terminal TPP binding domain-containing protein [Lentinula lateritia]